MDTSINDQIFMNRTMADCNLANSIYGQIDISEYRVLEEANGMLAFMDSNITTANSVLNGTEGTRSPNRESFHEVIWSPYGNDIFGGCTQNLSDQPYSCAWNAVYSQDLYENSIRYGHYNSSKCYNAQNGEDRGDASLSYGAQFQQNVFGGGTAFNSESGNDLNKYQSVEQVNNICEIFSDQGLPNELGLICGDVGEISHVGSDSSKYSGTCIHENFMRSTIGKPYNGLSFNQDDEMEMNARLLGYHTDDAISKLLNADKTSIEPLEFGGTKGIATVYVNELDGFDDETPLSTSYKTEIYSGEQTPQTVDFSVKVSENRMPINTAGSQLVKNDGNHQENGSRLDGIIAMNDANGKMVTLETGERESCNAKIVRRGANKSKGHPAKNLLAERRRRKRLAERLSMLRSVVPTITKMDRTSILSDTIEHTKQLLQQILFLHGELGPQAHWPAHLRAYEGYFRSAGIACDQKFADKHISKFEVNRTGSRDLNIHMTCQTNPSILLSTISTLESFGLDIQEAIISCFSDFGMQTHCSEIPKAKSNIRPEDIKLALLQTAGYLG